MAKASSLKSNLYRIVPAVCLVALSIGGSVFAQTFSEPSSPAPGGRSATWLDTSTTTQKKLGSLIVGDQSGNDRFCLNVNSLTDPDVGTKCIGSWPALSALIGGPFVETHANASLPLGWDEEDANSYAGYYQTGYVRIKGNALAVSDSVIATANISTDLGSSVAVYGSDDQDATSNAGNFSGNLEIVNYFGLATPGDLCLNTTLPYDPLGPLPRRGCINDWADIGAPPVGPYIQRQAANPPVIQFGSGRLSKSWQFGAAVAGEVTDGLGTTFCGDGLCSTQIGETAGSCNNDCNAFTGL